jgi:hypothetical protein
MTTSPSGRLRRDSSTPIEARTSISEILPSCSSSALNFLDIVSCMPAWLDMPLSKIW